MALNDLRQNQIKPLGLAVENYYFLDFLKELELSKFFVLPLNFFFVFWFPLFLLYLVSFACGL